MILNEEVDKKKAEKDYLKGMKYKDIAEKYNVSLNTVKSWIKRYKWSDKKGAPQNKKGAPYNNKNALGNRGGKGGPPENKKAETHGFFSKYLPAETIGIIQEIELKKPLDILWEQIVIQYAAIIRSQNLMYVKNQDDTTKIIKKARKGKTGDEVEYELQLAWDKQATFLNAQSRAMSTLQSMIKNYDEMLHKNWDLATEEQKQRIEKLKSEIDQTANEEKEIANHKLDQLSEVIKKSAELYGGDK